MRFAFIVLAFKFLDLAIGLPSHQSCPESLLKGYSSFELLRNISLSECLNGCAYTRTGDLSQAIHCLQDIARPKKKCVDKNKKCEQKQGKCIAKGKPKPSDHKMSGWCNKKTKCSCYIPRAPGKPTSKPTAKPTSKPTAKPTVKPTTKPCRKDKACKNKQGECYKRGSEPEGLREDGRCGKKCRGKHCFVEKSGE